MILGEIPRIAVVIDKAYSMSRLREFSDQGASILEVRFDLLGLTLKESIDYIAELQKIRNVGLLGTIRENDSNARERINWFKELIPYVDAIDIEVEWPDKDLAVSVARDSHKKIVLSLHDFEKTPPESELDSLITEADNINADYTKIAVMAKSKNDVSRLMQFCSKHQEKKMVCISMGEHGSISRLTAPIFGSLYSYASIDSEVAPGILSLEQMIALYRQFYPGFKGNSIST